MDKIDVLMELSAYGRDDLCEWANNNLQEKDGNATPDWMPIETAPIDGTAILAKLTDSDIPIPVRNALGTWFVTWDGYALSKNDGPNHWMHLPKPPTHNVEVTGAARLYRAASSDRRERGRPPG